MSQDGQKSAPVKLYLRIGEVADLVGVQPHVLRYWETEFRGTIRPQKSKKGQRVYSRADVDRLIKVKDLLRNQGFTIAGARKVLRESGASRVSGDPERTAPTASSAAASAAPVTGAIPLPAVSLLGIERDRGNPLDRGGVGRSENPVVRPFVLSVAREASSSLSSQTSENATSQPVQAVALQPLTQASSELEISLPTPGGTHSDRSAKRLRRALVELRAEVLAALASVAPQSNGGAAGNGAP
ncbi:MAG TPA: MerR family transcriptional regulator [Polyangiaceae bacterium]|nr:MerR family transcriptional regulator [Polyangiaceae bacterium]